MADLDKIKNIKKLFDQKSLLDTAIEIEKFLDFMNLYVYPNWFKGEVVDGPNVSRYWVSLTLQYDYKDMPDPMGARVLHDVGVKVDFREGTEMDPVDVKSPDDFRPNSKKPKLKPKKVWLVDISVPRKFIDEIDYSDLEDDVEDKVDAGDVSDAVDDGMVDDPETPQAPDANDEEMNSPEDGNV